MRILYKLNSFIYLIYFIFNINNVKCVTNTLSSSIQQKTEILHMEQINGTQNFRIYGKKGKDDKPWFDSRGDMRHIHCVRPGKCEKLKFSSCLGSNIPYTHTSLDLTDYFSQEQTRERLSNYQALQHVPKCWAVIQPFLCSVFTPKCEKINDKDMVYLPSLEMCKITLEPCKILFNTSYFPEFLKCNETLFPSKCNNDVREMKFNVTGECLEPLVPTEITSSYYDGIEGCGIQCKDPLYTDDEHRQIHKLIAWGATLCFFCNLFVIATFMIDWQNASKYPALIVFYINFCFLISCLGWLAQFTPGSREDIVCRKDMTLRHSEPSAGENLSCIVVFVLVYYFLTASMVWFVFLAYAWHLRAVGNVQDRIDKKGSYFHLVAWSLPLVLTITIMALSEVDGNSIVGICYVGYLNHAIRAGFLLGPLCGLAIVSGYFIIRGMIMLFGLKNFANDIKSTSASNKIHFIIVRMSLCAALTLVYILVTMACHLNEFKHSSLWTKSLREFIICKISSTFTDEHKTCKIENRPSVAILQLQLLCLFGSGIVISSWCWTPASIETWKRYVKKKCGKEINEEIKMQKHKVIAQTWAKREELRNKGRLSITLYNTHTDPVGLNFDVNDLNSSATNEISSTWANYLPQFVKRRFALTGATATNSSSHGGPRKSSLDSEISVSVRHFSVESRRNSVDSQVSVKFAEMKTKVASRNWPTSNGGHHHHHVQNGSKHHSKSRNRRRDFFATAGRKFSSRRESSTSIESQVIALKKTTYPCNTQKFDTGNKNAKNGKHLKRRSASAGLVVKPDDICNFLSKSGKFIIPVLQNQGLTTSDDEETSRASFKAHDSRLDILFRKHQKHFSDNDDEMDDNKLITDRIADNDDNTNERNNSKSKIDSVLKNMQKSLSFDNILGIGSKEKFDSCSRNSKNSLKSRNSRRSTRRNKKIPTNTVITAAAVVNKKNVGVNISDLNESLSVSTPSTSSYSSELDLPFLGGGLQSSYSGISNGGGGGGGCGGGKPHSRNSKTSCDVGIQANAHEIVTQTRTSSLYTMTTANNKDNNVDDDDDDDEDEILTRQLNAKNRRKSDYYNIDDDIEITEINRRAYNINLNRNDSIINSDNKIDEDNVTECHELLPTKHKDNMVLMTESEKLKMLLLPTK